MGRFKILGRLEIDGTTNVVDTDYLLYTVPSDYNAIVKLLVNNFNNGEDAQIRVYHLQSGDSVSPPASIGNIFYDEYLLRAGTGSPGGKAWCTLTMDEGDMIYVRSDIVDVNFIAEGLERLSK